MVDASLPHIPSDRPLRYLFLDLNAYFASVEQQERPELRGKPIAVVPLVADTTFVIAASYEAKAHGVKTVMRVDEAKRLCPGLVLVEGRPPVYVHYHDRVLEVVESVLPIEKVWSVDEMSFRLLGEERAPERAVALAKKMKTAIRKEVGQCLTCSIGIAPNAFLAKVGTEMQKPDGLVVLEAKDLPQALYGLKITDFAGINRRMQARINAGGIYTTQQMCEADPKTMRRAFGSVIGERWWHLLRGYDLHTEDSARKSLSHSHVMAPQYRTEEGVKQLILRLLHKASARLRSNALAAKAMEIHVSGRKDWDMSARLDATNDAVTFTERFLEAWPSHSFDRPIKAGVVFHDLIPVESLTPSLFGNAPERMKLSAAIDLINKKYGKNSVYLAGMEGAKDAAPERIAFNKTWLFEEGKDDNVWMPETKTPG